MTKSDQSFVYMRLDKMFTFIYLVVISALSVYPVLYISPNLNFSLKSISFPNSSRIINHLSSFDDIIFIIIITDAFLIATFIIWIDH